MKALLSNTLNGFAKKTRSTLLLSGLLNEPFVAMFALLPFILRQDLDANLFQISVFTMLKPVMAVFSFYWGFGLARQSQTLRSNLIWGWVSARLSFLFVLFFSGPWFVIFSAGLYCLFHRAITPAFMEILHINLQKKSSHTLFTLSSILNWMLSMIIGLYAGKILDHNANTWNWLFAITAALSLSAIVLYKKTPITGETSHLSIDKPVKTFSLKQTIMQPLKDSFYLLKIRKDFLHFQMGFMAGGFGLMIIIPASILFYADIIRIDHHAMSMSRLIYMGLGFILFSPLWRQLLKKWSMAKLTALVCFSFALFPIILVCSLYAKFWLFAALFFYGVAQAGSHLVWHLSGPAYADQENSALYSTVNVLTVGLRGLIGPLFGMLLCKLFGPITTLIIGSFICLIGSVIMQIPLFAKTKSSSLQKPIKNL